MSTGKQGEHQQGELHHGDGQLVLSDCSETNDILRLRP
jgi:hypothetical protein